MPLALLVVVLFSSVAAKAACDPGPNEVSFFKDADFKGQCVVRALGDFPNSNAIGLPNDSISSIRVGSNAQTVVCKDNDFKGDCLLFNKDQSFVHNSRVDNDQISSVKVQPLGTNQCVPAAGQASFYTNADFLGFCVVKSIGDFANAGAIGLSNDSISSVRVGPGAQIVACKDDDFKGDCILITKDTPLVRGDRVGNDSISSVKVQSLGTTACPPAANQVSFFTNADFLGACVVKSIGVYPTSEAIGLPNDSISSVKVGANVQAVICKDANFKGDCVLLKSSTNFLTGDRVGNDAVTAAKVQPIGTQECEPGANQASFFMHGDFLAPCVVKSIGDYANSDQIGLDDKQISSVKLGPGAEVCSYDQNDFGGTLQPITSSSTFLGTNNDTISSLRVRSAGTPCQAATAQAFVSAGIEEFSPGSEFRLVRILGHGFKPAEFVRLQITETIQGQNPSTDIRSTTADGSGNIDFKFTGSGGGVCSISQPRTFEVQGTGQTSGLVSNVARTGC